MGEVFQQGRLGALRELQRRSEPRYLDRASIDKLLRELGDEFRPVAATLAFAGLRVSEALALRWRDVDLDGAMLDVLGTKTAASAAPVPMIEELVTELREHRLREAARGLARVHRDALIFQTRTGQPQDRRNALRAIYAAGDDADLNGDRVEPVGCHDLRHSCAGLLFAARVPAPTHRGDRPTLERARDADDLCGPHRIRSRRDAKRP